jgi:hypothetical protein
LNGSSLLERGWGKNDLRREVEKLRSQRVEGRGTEGGGVESSKNSLTLDYRL